jgi:short-subunit dehydrogenase
MKLALACQEKRGKTHDRHHAVVALTETLYYELAVRKLNVNVSVLCPGYVRTNILSSNRPQDKYAAHRDHSTYDLEISKILREGVTTGMDPAEVAAKTFEAIRLNKFYILTHPAAKPGIQARMEDMLNERNPRFY